ncbi:MAG: bifunctional UDP-N-acetylmuramoyl-tripeptide:D-alanyl-D-alanine ligase/alanine racemase [Bacteroidia bacterium]|nr:bifunctional UDP-N-acetylmuramoyl-tripeptide:D-alanyl-D-alanine ligase/alanine racemase [Bacteroidia bacterium]
MITFQDVRKITHGKLIQLASDRNINYLVLDSRKAIATEDALFFAIKGDRHDGHLFIESLYKSGLRQFIVENDVEVLRFPEGNFLKVGSSIEALQKISSFHRSQFQIPIIGITGSNGKTIIKEWLYQLLSKDYKIVKNPGSYNSQIGVPLSVWQIQSNHELGIFEAGISQPGEMEKLLQIIQPTIGIFTNIGTAHDEGFATQLQKIEEKCNLFINTKVTIVSAKYSEVIKVLREKNIPILVWGKGGDIEVNYSAYLVSIKWKERNLDLSFQLPFEDAASRENAIHCMVLILYLGYDYANLQERINQLKSVPMRLQLKQGINNCQIIDDTYNNDLGGLQISLDFLTGQHRKKKTLVLSDILQSGLSENELVQKINNMIVKSGVTSFVGVGPVLLKNKNLISVPAAFFGSTQELLTTINWEDYQNGVVLVKGARVFQFEKIVRQLQRKIHETVMEIDLDAMVHNLNYIKSRLKASTKLMVMVKAFAYGSGSNEVASLLQYHKVDFLGVAYADEGVDLRKNQISLPIMVMNPSEDSFEAMIEYDLQPEIYNFKILKELINFLQGRTCKIHLKLDTGMHRLGFEEAELDTVINILKSTPNLIVISIFSHLAGADDPEHNIFTREQATAFLRMAEKIKTELKINPILHLLNSPGILRHKEYQLNMVRLGIGLYGVNPTSLPDPNLMPVANLKTIISQIKKVKAGDTVGYGRKGKATHDIVVATIAIGYADGFSRAFSQGKGIVSINGKKAPVIGNVCMDMTMIDITGIEAKEGDEVIIFGKGLPIQEVAQHINTIPYEILTNTSERVKRVFYAESI